MPQLDVVFFGSAIIYVAFSFLALACFSYSYAIPRMAQALKLRARFVEIQKTRTNKVNHTTIKTGNSVKLFLTATIKEIKTISC